NVPAVTGASISADRKTVAITMTEYQTGGWWGTVKLASAYLDAEDQNGVVHRINATGLESTDGVLTWRASVSLASLPSGTYTLRFYAKDAYGNISAPKILNGHQHDGTGPIITTYTKNNAPLQGARVSSLGDVYFRVLDDIDTSPTVTQVRLSGGPANDNINLGFHRSGSQYNVEFPQMLPSLANDDYTLTITAKDASNNLNTVTTSFDYGPPRLELDARVGPDIAIPHLGMATRRSDGLWPLTTVPVVLEDAGGMPVTGRGALTLALSADAQGPLSVGGITIQPGRSAVYPNYDFDANGGAVTLPVNILSAEQTQPGRYGTLILQTDRAGAPSFIEDVVVWTSAESLEITQRNPSFARHVEMASLQLVNVGNERCRTLLVLKDGADYVGATAPQNVAICAARWVELPPDITSASTDTTRLIGLIRSDDESVTLRYQPGFLVRTVAESSTPMTFYPSGDPLEHTIALHDPEPPTIRVGVVSARAGQTDWLPDGKYPTDIGDIVSGYANGRADFKGLHMVITDTADGTVKYDQTFSSNVARAEIRTNIAQREGEQVLRVDLSYTNHPTIASSATLTFVATPSTPVLKLVRPVNPINISETTLEGRLGLATRTEVTYDPDVLGRWEIRIYKREGSTTLVPLGNPTTEIAADGTFRINLGTLDAGTYPILAEATYLGTSPGIDATVRSLQTSIRVFDGTPVPFRLVTSRDSGRAPMNALVKMALTDSRRYGDVGLIHWERSRDGVTFEKVELEARYSRSFGHVERLVEAGEYWYRATTVNRYSERTYTGEPLKVHIYTVPNFTLSGYSQTFNGTPVQWTAVPEAGQRPAVYRWTVRRGKYNDPEPLLFEGPTQTLAADVDGSWYVTVESRFTDAPDVTGSWRKVSTLLKVGPPAMSRPRIVGPYSVENGKTYRYTATTYIPISGTASPDLVVVGRWQLPDGSTQDGDTLDLTIGPDDTELRYTAWINGYRAETEQTSLLRLRPWNYVFPKFQLSKRLVREFDPTQYTYTLTQVSGSGVSGGEVPSYQWSFPSGAQVTQKTETVANVSASASGDYPVSVRVYDTRGNQVELQDAFTVSDAPPISATMRILVGDSWNRAPATVTARWYADGLLSKETVTAITVKLDGTTVSERVLSSYSFNVTEVGTHVVDIELLTSYGRTARYSSEFEMVTGELPQCELNVTTGTSLRAQADCVITMGRLTSYRWDVTYADNGDTRDLGQRSSTVYFTESEIARGISRIRMVAINDKGQAAEPAIWTP
ncbi:MAG: hypothetical protein EOM91_10320, partial [Sphingobacteriia bacterium]|nr:hypothetical protein [Sphingobacteriia bacterium]